MNAPEFLSVPRGLCQCGCGKKTPLANHNDKSKGWVKGEPIRFIRGHTIVLHRRKIGADNIGTKSVSSHGYVLVRVAAGVDRYEHALVAERALGRPLRNCGRGHPDTEVIHHIDGDKTNNAPENLLICTHRYHTELHHRLEQSPAWPEFPPIIRRGFGCARIAK